MFGGCLVQDAYDRWSERVNMPRPENKDATVSLIQIVESKLDTVHFQYSISTGFLDFRPRMYYSLTVCLRDVWK